MGYQVGEDADALGVGGEHLAGDLRVPVIIRS
jgi:hypothetical protein